MVESKTIVHIVEILGAVAFAHHFWPKGIVSWYAFLLVVSSSYLKEPRCEDEQSSSTRMALKCPLSSGTLSRFHSSADHSSNTLDRHMASKRTGRKLTASGMSMDQNLSPSPREVAVRAVTAIDDRLETIEDMRMNMMNDQDTRSMPARDTRSRAWVTNTRYYECTNTTGTLWPWLKFEGFHLEGGFCYTYSWMALWLTDVSDRRT